MQNKSIFHRIVSKEDEYTQLLCNMLQREEGLLRDLFDEVGLGVTKTIKPEEIRTKVCLSNGGEGWGEADLIIQSDEPPKVCAIFEVKTSPYRKLEKTQQLDEEPKSYRCWLEKKKAEEYDAWLVYLVPGDWEYKQDNDKNIEAYRRKGGENTIHVRYIFWEDVLRLLQLNDPPRNSPFIIEQFRLLLMDRLGPISFTSEEIKCMFKPDFPMETIIKLNSVLDGLKQKATKKATLKQAGDSNEFGFYLTDGKRELFIGLWLNFWNAGYYFPICFGIQDEDSRVKEEFSKAFLEAFGKSPISIEDGQWTMGWVPQEEFNRFETASGAINEIWAKLAPIWKRVKEAQ